MLLAQGGMLVGPRRSAWLVGSWARGLTRLLGPSHQGEPATQSKGQSGPPREPADPTATSSRGVASFTRGGLNPDGSRSADGRSRGEARRRQKEEQGRSTPGR